ncbi:hypothetical protein H072_2251 [Dactylellina haptotyla CBS 200.50]|uniref:Aminoglycoside phosphotransferase domain-containing protein n=1 Tax=Dactylellina haptotyla (strain CBS 200.50) TaxID=1284197 RepID=S8ARW2_DACHA|nr:hypothetical protein H072_2251 [Dactylellina haptotyla CBS 200.50]
MEPPLHETLTDAQIAHFYESHIQFSQHDRIVSLSHEAIIKSGPFVKEEAENLIAASKILDWRVVKVPQLYRAFKYRRIWYMVMEQVHGRQGHKIPSEKLVEKMTPILGYFKTLEHATPGPLTGLGGVCRGDIWGVYEEAPVFEKVGELEQWVDRWLPDSYQSFEFKKRELVFCHMDLVAENIIINGEGNEESVYLLAWKSGGWFPRNFEVAELELAVEGREDLEFERLLAKRITKKICKDERKEIDAIKVALRGRELDQKKENKKLWKITIRSWIGGKRRTLPKT